MKKEKTEGRRSGEEPSLAERLARYRESGACPMHMPGHKRNSPFLWMEPLAALDITEIDGFDNLHEARGILREGMERMARVWGSRRSFFLVNGSTCGILAGIASLTRPGDSILMARGCHRSVYHGVELNRLRPVYLWPGLDPETGIQESIRPEQVEQAVEAHPGLRLAVLTSPTYEGILSDLPAIREILHRRGIPLLVDEAHGAHLGFSAGFPGGAVQAGADLVVHSLHKTLPSLTQTAAIHVCGDLADPEKLERQLSIYETSSPSYLLMASIDSCVRLLEREGGERFAAYEERLARFGEQVRALENLQVLGYGRDSLDRHPGFWKKDPGKLVLLPRQRTQSGAWLMEQLRQRFGIELEMAQEGYALAMTSLCDTEENLNRLAEALKVLDGELEASENRVWKGEPEPMRNVQAETHAARREQEIPLPLLWSWEALERPGKAVQCQAAVGRVMAEYLWAYPPGIPLAVPGEQVTEAMVARWRQMEQAGVELFTTSGRWKDGKLMCLADTGGKNG